MGDETIPAPTPEVTRASPNVRVIDPEVLRGIEHLPGWGPIEKTHLLLVALGIKRAALESVASEAGEAGVAPGWQTTLDTYVKAAHAAGLAIARTNVVETDARRRDGTTYRRQQVSFTVAETQETADATLEAYRDRDDWQLGLTLGYPISGIKAWKTEHAIRNSELPTDIDPDVRAFALWTTMNAPEGIWESTRIATQWRDTVRATSPTLYKEYLEQMDRVWNQVPPT